MFNFIERELIFLKENWPNSLPKGVIHADVFQDNVFFIDNNFSGLIDFYFSCTDYYAYDLALTINAWCFDYKRNFSQEKFMSLMAIQVLAVMLKLKILIVLVKKT